MNWFINNAIGRWVGGALVLLVLGFTWRAVVAHGDAIDAVKKNAREAAINEIDNAQKTEIDRLRVDLEKARADAYWKSIQIEMAAAALDAERKKAAEAGVKEVFRVSPQLVEGCVLDAPAVAVINCVRRGGTDCRDLAAGGSGPQ